MIAAVVGAGTMGLGIAHAFAINGVTTTLCEPVPEARDRAQRQFDAVLDDGARRGKLTDERAARARAGLNFVAAVSDVPIGADIVIESVPERLELKQQVLRDLESRGPQIIGSNTSSLSIDSLAERLARPERFLGVHFFNPVWAKTLVEVVVGSATSEETLRAALGVAKAIGKETITVKDSPGFTTSRLGVILGLEAIRLLESGAASAEDIDTVMTLGYAHAMGPLRLTDLVGLDVRLDIARNLQSVYGDRFAPPNLLQQMVAEGRLGKKSGRGFFDW